MSEPDPGTGLDPELRAYTILTARLLGIDLADDEIEPVVAQVARVAGLVEEMGRIDDEAVTPAPRFRPGPAPGQRPDPG